MSTIKKNVKQYRRSMRTPAIAEPRMAAVVANINIANQAAEDRELDKAIKQHERKGMAIDPDYVAEEEEEEHKNEPADTPLVFPSHDNPSAALLESTRAYSTLSEFGDANQRITAKHQDKLVLLDVEFANLEGDSPIVQLAAISVDGKSVVFNAYARHGTGKLHADWEDLIRDHDVKRDPWDSPACPTFTTVFERFLAVLPVDAILLFKGVIDVDRMQKTLARLPQSQSIHATIAAKQIHFLSIDRFWFSLCDLLPRFLRKQVMTARGSMAAQLGHIFDDTMYKPVLVFINQELDQQEEVVDMDIAQPLFTQDVSKLGPTMQIEWGVTKRMAPVWHTAHTDVLIMLAISNLLITYAFMRVPLLQLVINLKAPASIANRSIHDLTREEVAFALLATRVALDTKWLREKTLLLSDAGGSYMWKTCSELSHIINTTKVRGLLSNLIIRQPDVAAAAAVPLPPDDDDMPDLVPVTFVKHKNNAPSIMLARKKRLALPEGVAVVHDSKWHRVYKPVTRGADAMKVRALKSLVGTGTVGPDKTVFERLERLRGEAGAQDTIGMKPYWYMVRAVGASGPGCIILHSRSCLDAYNGNDYGEEKDANSDAVSFIDFAAMPKKQGPIGFTCKFCRNCKRAANQVYAAWPHDTESKARHAQSDPLMSLVLPLFMLRRFASVAIEPPPLNNFLFYAGDEPRAAVLEALRVEHGLDAVSHLDSPTWAGPDDLLCLFTHEQRDTEIESFLLQFEEIEVCRKLLFVSGPVTSSLTSIAAWQRRGLVESVESL